jgi:bifunctional DNA-binding transcriptional regulator/antitoxin component of YhaV-PrlF toxin-antitoxin module
MAANGRLVVPTELRRKIGLSQGGALVARIDNGALILEPLDQVIADIQREVARYVPPGVSLVDELIAERRAEATDE